MNLDCIVEQIVAMRPLLCYNDEKFTGCKDKNKRLHRKIGRGHMKIKWKSCFKVGVSIFLLYLCIYYWPSVAGLLSTLFGAAMPLVIGCAIAYVINILMSFYEKHYFTKKPDSTTVKKSRRPVCMIAAFLTLIAIVLLVFALVVPQLVSCMQLIVAELPDALNSLFAFLERFNILPEDIARTLENVDWQARIKQLLGIVTSGLGSVVNTVVDTVSTVASGVVNAVLGIIFSLYILAGKERLGQQCDRLINRYMKKSLYDKVRHVLAVMNDCFHRYIVGQCTEALILGVLCTLGMLILRLPYATMIGALIALTALIPVAGAYIGAGVGAFMILTDSPVKAVIFLIFIVVLQQLEGNLIYPRVVGSSMGLPAIWVLAAVTIGGGLMGIGGMLLGVPLAATIYRLLREDVNRPARGAAEAAK